MRIRIFEGIVVILLIIITLFPYTKYPLIGQVAFLFLFFLFLIHAFILKKELKIKRVYYPIIISFLFLFLYTLIQGLIRINYNLTHIYIDIFSRVIVIAVTILYVSNLSFNFIYSVLKKAITIFWGIGIITLTVKKINGVYLVNENTMAFFMIPYLGCLITNNKNITIKILVFFFGASLLYFTNGRASLYAFLLTPLWLFIIKKTRLIIPALFLMILINLIIPFFFIEFLLDLDDKLSGRGTLLYYYTSFLKNDLLSLILGTGGELLQNGSQIIALGAHNSWVGIIWSYGLIGLLINLIIIFQLLKNVTVDSYSVSLLLIIFYIIFVQSFETINLGGISFFSLLLLISLLLVRINSYHSIKKGNITIKNN